MKRAKKVIKKKTARGRFRCEDFYTELLTVSSSISFCQDKRHTKEQHDGHCLKHWEHSPLSINTRNIKGKHIKNTGYWMPR